jgi:hypothetical protein
MNSFLNKLNIVFLIFSIFIFIGCENSVEGNLKDPVPTNGLVVYYDFEDITGAQVRDLSGNNNNAALVGDYDTVEILSQNALALTGSGYAFLENPQNLPTGNSSRTLTYWIQLNEISPAQIFGGYGNTQNCENFQGGLDTTSGELLSFFGWGECNHESTTNLTELVDERFHHIAYVYNGSILTMYLDGVAIGSETLDLNTTASTLCVGGEVSGSSCVRLFNGNIDEFRIYNRALTSGEIETFVNN